MSEDINTPNNGEELDNIIILNDENGNEVSRTLFNNSTYRATADEVTVGTKKATATTDTAAATQ